MSDSDPVRMEEVPQNISMGPPEVQFYLERVSQLLIEMYLCLVTSEHIGLIGKTLVTLFGFFKPPSHLLNVPSYMAKVLEGFSFWFSNCH